MGYIWDISGICMGYTWDMYGNVYGNVYGMYMGGSIVMGVPPIVAGWFISWNIPSQEWMIGGHHPFRNPPYIWNLLNPLFLQFFAIKWKFPEIVPPNHAVLIGFSTTIHLGGPTFWEIPKS